MEDYIAKIIDNNLRELMNRKEVSELIIDLFPNHNKLNEKEIQTLKSMLLIILLIYTKNNMNNKKENE